MNRSFTTTQALVICGTLIMGYLITGLVIILCVGNDLGTLVTNIVAIIVLMVVRPRFNRAYPHEITRPSTDAATRRTRVIQLWPAVLAATTLAPLLGGWLYYHNTGAHHNYQPVQNEQNSWNVALIIISLVIISPIAEELIMRGMIYPVLRRRYSIYPSIAVTSILFAILHGNIIQISYTIWFSVIFCAVYEITHKITWAVSAHLITNAIALVLPIDDIAKNMSLYTVSSLYLIMIIIVMLNCTSIIYKNK